MTGGVASLLIAAQPLRLTYVVFGRSGRSKQLPNCADGLSCGAPAGNRRRRITTMLRGAALMRSMPSAVLAPVEQPPCMRHRPFGIAGDRQGVPLPFVLAPHLGALLDRPVCCRCAASRAVCEVYRSFLAPAPGLAPPAPHAAGCHDGLPTRADSDVLMHNLDRRGQMKGPDD